MKIKTSFSFFTRPIVLLLLGSFLLRLGLASFGTLTLDQNTFIAWAHNVNLVGLNHFYDSWSDYLPGYVYVLWLLGRLELLLNISPVILYKLPAILGDVAAGLLVYNIVKEIKNKRIALIASDFVLLNPAFLSNSTFWGQVDVLTALFAVLSVYLLKRNWLLSALCLAVGSLIKPQAALAAPVVLYLMVSYRFKIKDIILYILVSGAIFLLGFVPFLNSPNLISFVIERLSVTLGQYPYTSINAFNFWGLWGFWNRESESLLSEKNIGLVLFVIVSVVTFIKNKGKKNSEYLMLFVLFLSNFLFFTRMHERHLLPSLLPLVIYSSTYPALFLPVVILSLTYVLNMHYAYVWIVDNFKTIYSSFIIGILIILNIVSLFFALAVERISKMIERLKTFLISKESYKQIKSYLLSFWKQKEDPSLISKITQKYSRNILLAILLFAFLSRIIGLGNPPHEYFDEVYHAFTARAMLQGNVKAWEWWNENPEGFAYEWTHPPLAKEAMVVGMLLFSETSFGWRIPAAILGVGIVFLIFKLGEKLFNKEVGLLSAFVFSLDGLSLVLNRIGMNDTYLVFFLLLSFLLFFNEKYFWAALALGLSAASKWTAFWFFPILFVASVLKHRRVTIDSLAFLIPPFFFFGSISSLDSNPASIVSITYTIISLFILLISRKRPRYLYFLIIPFIVYLLSYLPQFLTSHTWDIFWGMQRQMWWYHTRLVATHPYESKWWTWPLLLRPIWLYTSGNTNGYIANIYAMGNPIVFWGGLVSVLTSIYYAFVEKRKNLLLILACYGGVFVPWAVSPRIMFLYHYFPAIPFLSLATGFVLYKNKKFILPFLVLSLLSFIYFYPHWAGISVPTWLDNSYYWLPGWR